MVLDRSTKCCEVRLHVMERDAHRELATADREPRARRTTPRDKGGTARGSRSCSRRTVRAGSPARATGRRAPPAARSRTAPIAAWGSRIAEERDDRGGIEEEQARGSGNTAHPNRRGQREADDAQHPLAHPDREEQSRGLAGHAEPQVTRQRLVEGDRDREEQDHDEQQDSPHVVPDAARGESGGRPSSPGATCSRRSHCAARAAQASKGPPLVPSDMRRPTKTRSALMM